MDIPVVATMGKWIATGVRLMPHLLQAMIAVEKLKTADPGPQKREAAIDLAVTFWVFAEQVTDRDLGRDEEFRDLVGRVMDAIAALQKFLARRGVQ